MKFKELKEHKPLKVVEVTNHILFQPFVTSEDLPPRVSEKKQIQTRVFTDGQIEKESEETSKEIEEYYIGKKKYKYDVDTLKSKKIYLKNHTYAITCLIAKEYMTVGNVTGWFDVIQDISIYLENPKDKRALKKVKQVISQISNRNSSVDYSSLFGMFFSRSENKEKLEYEEVSKNVYKLKYVRK